MAISSATKQELLAITFYAVARLGYSLFERRDIACVAWELFSSCLFLGGSLGILIKWPTVRSIGPLFIIYMVTAVLPYMIVRRPPIETSLSKHKHPGNRVVWFGIIDGVWLTIMGATCALIVGGQLLGVVGGPTLEGGHSAQYYQAALQECWFFLGFVTSGLLATGGALGGCMAILWAGAIWRTADEAKDHMYRNHTLASLKMVTAYFVVAVAATAWASIPLYNRAVEIRELMRFLK